MTATFLAILTKMVAQIIGYNFVCKVSVYMMELWGKSTKTHFDDRVFNAIAEQLGVPSSVLKKLVEDADSTGAI